MSRQPDAIIIGAARASTTSLFYALSRHPDIFGLRDKEPNWYVFSGPVDDALQHGLPSRKKSIADRAARTPEAFADLFEGYAGEKISLEASPVYLHLPGVEANIRANNPDARLIVIRREPADLLLSMYSAFLKRDLDTFEDYFFGDAGDDDKGPLLEFVDLDRHIARYKATFPQSQILEVDFEQLASDPDTVLATILAFLDLPPHPDVTLQKMNESGAYRKGTLGSTLGALDKRKELLRRFVPNGLKTALLPYFHKMRSRARMQGGKLDDGLRERVRRELLDQDPRGQG